MMFVAFVLPVLEALSCLCTIWGFAHTPNVADTVVTYGASGPDAPDVTMWINSFGSIAFGLITFAATWIAKNKLGFKSKIYTAVIYFMTHQDDKLAAVQLFFAALDVFCKTLPDTEHTRDFNRYVRQWVMAAYVRSTIPDTPVIEQNNNV